MPKHATARPPRIFAGLLALIGVFLLGGGAWLAVLGGSPYYVLAGAATTASALLLWRGKALGSALFQLTTVATVMWAVWEAGFDFWAIAPRVVLPLFLMAWLYTPWVRRGLHSDERGDELGDDEAGIETQSAEPWKVPRGRNATAMLALTLLGGAAFLGMHQLQAQEDATNPAPRSARDSGEARMDPLSGAHYAALNQIDEHNVGDLERAWTYRSGDILEGGAEGAIAITPIEARGALYFCTPHGDAVALDALSGEERWRFAARDRDGLCAGIAYHAVANANGICAAKIVGIRGRTLFAVDADSGTPCTSFGENGFIALDGTGGHPMIAGDHILVGRRDGDGKSALVSAFGARDGSEEWKWQGDGDFGVIAPFSADPALGLVYVATGAPTLRLDASAPTDFETRYADAVVALDMETGAPRWSFQTAHNDVWNYGLSAQPVLVDLPTPDGVAHALVQATKQGDVFVLDRENGRPMTDFAERPVPAGAGLALSATQPRSEIAFVPEPLTEKDMWGFTPLDQMVCRIQFQRARYEGPFTPPGSQPTITYPGAWSAMSGNGIAVDQKNKLIVANTSAVATYDRIVQSEEGQFEKVSEPFAGPLGAPCNEPPWGFLHLFDLKTTEPAWSKPIGSARDSGPFGLPLLLSTTIGTPNVGASLVTGGAVIFNAATTDRRLTAYHLFTGEELWSAGLPAGGQATPMTYETDGRQFVVVAAGGNPELGTEAGDYIVAYALPGT